MFNSYNMLLDQYKALQPQIRLIVLHPSASFVHRFFGALLLKEDASIYAHLPKFPPQLPLQHILDIFTEAIATQLGILLQIPDDYQSAITTIASALNQHENCTFFIDGYEDTSNTLNEFVIELVQHLAVGKRIALSGRAMPMPLIDFFSPLNKVAILPVDTEHMYVDYTHPQPDKVFVEVHAFGQGAVWVNGYSIEQWEGQLPRSLFFYMIDRAMATRDNIFKTFWPRLSPREATNVFHVTKRKITEILKINLTVYNVGFYRLSDEIDLHYDVVNFQKAIQQAVIADDKEARRLYQVAIDLYREDFLTDLESDWARRRREEMRNTYLEALIGLARINEKDKQKEKALGLFLRATGNAPHREDLVRDVMRLHAELGQKEYAFEAYEQLRAYLKNKLNVTPDPLTVQLAEKIRHQS